MNARPQLRNEAGPHRGHGETAEPVEPGDRGRDAATPAEIPRAGLLDVAARVWKQLGTDNVSLLAAGVGLFALLAAFPALAAVVSIYGLFSAPEDIARQLATLQGLVPQEALRVFTTQLQAMAHDAPARTVGIGVIVTLVIALWSARKGVVAIMSACNVAYGESERRSWLRQTAVSLLFTFGAVVYFIITLGVGAALPFVLKALFGAGALTEFLSLLRWPLLWAFVVLALAVTYRFAPARTPARWRWVSWGALIAASLWVVGGILFEVYLRNLGNFGNTYGALGGVIVLLLWLYLTGYIVILGAEINAELEHQTRRDTTVGPEAPMGRRGAYVADTLGRSRR
jgi:membrane protein